MTKDTGAHGFSLDRATAVAARTVRSFLETHPGALDSATFCCYRRAAYESYRTALSDRP